MNAIDKSSGAASAARIARYLRSDCGFGTCCADPNYRDRHCPEHPCNTSMLGLPVLDTMTDDRFNLHRVDTSQLGHTDGRSVGACRTDIPLGFVKPVKPANGLAKHLKTAAMVVAAGLALACTFYVSIL